MDADQIRALLATKAEIDRRNATSMNFINYDRWVADALEALLAIALQETGRPREKPATGS